MELVVAAIFWSYVLVGWLCYRAGKHSGTLVVNQIRNSDTDPVITASDDPTPRAWRKSTYVDGPTD